MRAEIMSHSGPRYCAGCGARLARDNREPLCSPCARAGEQGTAPRHDADFWCSVQMRDALATRDMGVVVRAYRRHPAHGRKLLPQADVAHWLNITQGQLSRIESGRNRVGDLDKLVHYDQAKAMAFMRSLSASAPTLIVWIVTPRLIASVATQKAYFLLASVV